MMEQIGSRYREVTDMWNEDNQYECDGCGAILPPDNWRQYKWRGGYYCSEECMNNTKSKIETEEQKMGAE